MSPFARRETLDSGAGPVGPAGPGVGGPGSDAHQGSVPGRPLHPDHHSRPLQGLPGPLRCLGLLLGLSGPWRLGTRYYPPCIPTRIPALVPYPATRHRYRTPRRGLGNTRNSQFWDPVGEPRGVRTQPVIGSQTGLYCIWDITRPFDWFMTVL